jgi:hypothetical protein
LIFIIIVVVFVVYSVAFLVSRELKFLITLDVRTLLASTLSDYSKLIFRPVELVSSQLGIRKVSF